MTEAPHPVSGPAPASSPAVDVHDLRTVAGRRRALDGVSLQVERAEVVAVLGRAGAGRTALVRALAGLDYRARGRMLVLPRTGHLPQDARLFGWRRARDVVAAGGEGHDRDAAIVALQRVGLRGKERHRARSLSVEERRRVALARAVVDRPSVLLLDEPTRGMDPGEAAELRATLQRLFAEDRPAVVLTTSDVDEALLLADRVVVLGVGRIRAEVDVDRDGMRHRSGADGELRCALLAALAVDEDADGDRT